MAKSKTILVAGGAGFLGANLCATLLHEGHTVICLDDLSSGTIENVSHMLNLPNFKFINHDLRQSNEIYFEQVFNLACPASPQYYSRDLVKTIETNLIGTINLLLRSNDLCARYLHASTSEVYGQALEHPQKESYNGNVRCFGVRASYSEGKRAAESICYAYMQEKKIDVRIARIFNSFGPKMRIEDGRVIPNFIRSALVGAPLKIYGNGEQTRSFCYVDDTIDGLIKLMNYEGDIQTPINIGSCHEVTISRLANKIIELTNTSSSVKHETQLQDDPFRRCPDISLAKALLNWDPTIPFEEGLMRTISHYQKLIIATPGCEVF